MSNIRKQTMIIAVLIVLIACAAWFAKMLNEGPGNTDALNQGTKQNTGKQTTTNFFSESRMSKDNERSAIKQGLEDIVSNQDSTKEAKETASNQLMKLLERGDKENEIETHAKERGFSDAICFIDDNGVELTVKSEQPLTAEQAALLKDIVVRTTALPPSKITISQRN